MNDQSDIGKQLTEAREIRRLSLKDVAHETCIPLGTLQALEANDYSSFPNSTYTKSFLDQYSAFLKIDADEVIENLQTENVLDQSERIKFLEEDTATKSPRISPTRRKSASTSPGKLSKFSQPLLIMLITGGLIAAGVWGLIVVEKRLNADPETADTTTPGTAPKDPQKETTPKPEEKIVSTIPTTQKPDRPARVISLANNTPIASTTPESPEEDPDAPVYAFPEHQAAPRAIIVNEDEDE